MDKAFDNKNNSAAIETDAARTAEKPVLSASGANAKTEEIIEFYESQLREQEKYSAAKEYELMETKERNNRYINLNRVLRYYEVAYVALRGSFSWRVTKPLRWLMAKLKGTKEELPNVVNLENIPEVVTMLPPPKKPIYADKYIHGAYTELQPLDILHIQENTQRMNVVLDSLDKGDVLAGGAVALIIASEYCIAHSVPLRIICRKSAPNPLNYYEVMELYGCTAPPEVEFYSDQDRAVFGAAQNKLEVSKSDIFLAAEWHSAYAVQQTFKNRRFFYLVQNDAPRLSALAQRNCYKALMQSQSCDFIFLNKGQRDILAVDFPSVLADNICLGGVAPKLVLAAKPKKKSAKKTLVVCASPQKDTDSFGLCVQAINSCLNQKILDEAQWDIFLETKDNEEIIFSNNVLSKNTKIMRCKEYASLLQNADLVVSLDVGLVPCTAGFIAASFGAAVLANSELANMDVSGKIVLSTMQDIGEDIRQGIILAGGPAAKMPASSEVFLGWQPALKETVLFMGAKQNV